MSDVENDQPSVAAVLDEVLQLRKESAAGHARTARELAKNASPEASRTPRASHQRATNNSAASHKNFFVLVGPGAEDEEQWEDDWVTLMSSELAHQHFQNAFGRQIVRTINFESCDLKSTDWDVLNAALAVAAGVGKRARLTLARLTFARRTPHICAPHDCTPHAASRACLAVKPTDFEADDSTDEESDDDDVDRRDRAAVRAAAKKAAKRDILRGAHGLVRGDFEDHTTWNVCANDRTCWSPLPCHQD